MKVIKARTSIVTSIIAIVISFSMLIGSTFAWFTDSSMSGINKIHSGNLDVGLVYTNSYNGKAEEVNENTKIFADINGDDIVWEPGAFASGRFEVSNNGSLALKYQLSIIYANATQTANGKTLADALSVYALVRNKDTGTDTVMGDSSLEALQIDSAVPEYDPMNAPSFKDGFTLEAYLHPQESITYEIGIYWNPTDNDNEFNVPGGLSIDFAVALVATQVSYENDGDGFYYDSNAQFPALPVIPDSWDGSADTTWFDQTKTEFSLSTAEAIAGFSQLVDAGETFEGKTIKLENDIDLSLGEDDCFDPIGSYRHDKAFKGTFDGQGHTIYNLQQNTWALDNGYYYNDCGLGLFGAVEDATIKNLTLDGAEISGESAICGGIVAVAGGECVFENITVKNADVADYQYYAGGVVGWASGDHTYKNIVIDESTVIGGQWGDFANANGGIIGGASTDGTYHFEDCTIACRIDAVNDVVSAYQWYCYRNCGMLIGQVGPEEIKNESAKVTADNVTCKNVTVIYGDWANYTYCEFAGTGYPYVRVQGGVSVDPYTNIRYGHPTDANGNTVVDDNHVHNDGEDHNLLLVFDQLFGGPGNARYCYYGIAEHPGVTVIYNNK
ncbi:MAG: hypothetical protein E7347_05650 [Clostridiales bacterium]|nr:hypothetical protein [Clostridiales bacterium]